MVIFLLVLIVFPLILLLPLPSPFPYPRILPESVNIYAQVGNYYLESLSGWGSPFAEVTLISQNLIRKTNCDQNGFFSFHSLPIPDHLGELCLFSQDIHQFPSFPICLAPPPGNQNLQIKDILLPPTLSVAGSQIPNGKTAKASGMTFPSSEVDVYLFTTSQPSIWSRITEFKVIKFLTFNFKLAKPAFAVGLPHYRIKSNQEGYFEFSLPANFPSFNRVYAAAIFFTPEGNKGYSPKSNTLAFETIGWWGWLLFILRYLWSLFVAFLIYLKSSPLAIIIGEVLILSALILLLISAFLTRRKEGH